MCRTEAELFRVLGVESRLKILDLLKRKGHCCVNEMSGEIGITASAVSQHLRVLRHAGLVRSERKGYWIPYEVDEDALDQCRRVLEQVCACGCRMGQARGDSAPKPADETLADLTTYEARLQEELVRVRERIEALKPKEEGR